MAGILKADKARKSTLPRLRKVALALVLLLLALLAASVTMLVLGLWVPGRAWLS